MQSILIVDDEPLTREFLKLNISSIDPQWSVQGEAANGAEALEFLNKFKVDLVITDIKMPVMDGIELCREIKLKWPAQEIVILSGYDEFAFAQQAMRYHVHGYLLKPIKISAIKEILNEVSEIITKRKKETIAFNTLKNLSIDYESHLCRSYIRAIIQNSNTEIEALHPMIYKMKVDLMQSAGIILILKLDIESVILQKLPPNDLPVFFYILYQITSEIVDDKSYGFAVLDSDENTVVYITGDGEDDIENKCELLFASVSDFIKEHTGLSVTGFIGTSKTEILEMYSSYKDAAQLIPLSLIKNGKKIFKRNDLDDNSKEQINALEKFADSVVNSLVDGSDDGVHITLNSYINEMKALTPESVLKYSLYLTNKIKLYNNKIDEERLRHFLVSAEKFADEKASGTNGQNLLSQQDVFAFYYKFITVLWGKEENGGKIPPTQKLVDNAKEYVYEHFAEPITLSQVADSLDVSVTYLSKVFHDVVGESYIKFITRVRMEYAARLIKANPNEHIFSVAEKAGYFSLKHFNYVFKEFYNMTPTEYQSKNK